MVPFFVFENGVPAARPECLRSVSRIHDPREKSMPVPNDIAWSLGRGLFTASKRGVPSCKHETGEARGVGSSHSPRASARGKSPRKCKEIEQPRVHTATMPKLAPAKHPDPPARHPAKHPIRHPPKSPAKHPCWPAVILSIIAVKDVNTHSHSFCMHLILQPAFALHVGQEPASGMRRQRMYATAQTPSSVNTII